MNVLIVPVNETEVRFEKIKREVRRSELFESLKLNFSHYDGSINIPSDTERAAPWHNCPVTKELDDFEEQRCYKFNYCLMYVIDEIEKLYEKYPDIDCYSLIFTHDPIISGGVSSYKKQCICVKNDIGKIIDEFFSFTNEFMERD